MLIAHSTSDHVSALPELTTFLFIRVVAAVVHFVADLVCAQTHVVVSATERPCRRAGKFGWRRKDTRS